MMKPVAVTLVFKKHNYQIQWILQDHHGFCLTGQLLIYSFNFLAFVDLKEPKSIGTNHTVFLLGST